MTCEPSFHNDRESTEKMIQDIYGDQIAESLQETNKKRPTKGARRTFSEMQEENAYR